MKGLYFLSDFCTDVKRSRMSLDSLNYVLLLDIIKSDHFDNLKFLNTLF